ncbi:hypothetical protein RND71_018463 [Anisodus tanguticus]|uniref:peroxidase n=1 Tax=Anisodus tanguticus TaxID=243964 RepID=A0AAE1S4U7_9SOLA|nr:hypothetical protein RND71_018463 [Anisodus tanguticus]
MIFTLGLTSGTYFDSQYAENSNEISFFPIPIGIVGSSYAQLQLNFYAKRCPQSENIIQDYVQKHIPNAPSLAAALLRLQFHDCFVRGCDGSVLLNFTSSTKNQTEKVAVPNQTLRGFSFIDGVKKAVEAECSGVVSCADIVAFVARDSVVVTKKWKNIKRPEALANIPPPTSNFSSLQTSFASKGLDLKDLVLFLENKCDNKSYINQLVQGSLKQFNAEFGKAMEKMGSIEVKTGSAGEIRKHCAAVNS